MFKATISNTSLIKDSIATIAELIDEGIFKLTKDGISFVAADRAMVAVVDWNITSSAFDNYELEKDQTIGLNITNLNSVLKRASGSDKLSFNLQDSKLVILMEGTSRRRFTLPLLDLSQEEIPPIDQLAFTSKVELKPEILQSGIDDAEIVSDSVLFECVNEKFSMRAEGDISRTELELERGNSALLDMKANDNVRSRYPIDYLKKMVKAAKIADSVSLEFGQDYPMKLGFKAMDKVSLKFVIAPRVQEE